MLLLRDIDFATVIARVATVLNCYFRLHRCTKLDPEFSLGGIALNSPRTADIGPGS